MNRLLPSEPSYSRNANKKLCADMNKHIVVSAAVFLPIILALLLAMPSVFANNDPGHDTLYIEEQGDSELNGSINVTNDARIEQLIDAVNLQIRGTSISSSINRIYSDNGNLYIESPNNIIFNDLIGTTSTVRFGQTGDSVDIDVTGTITQSGTSVCLSDGTNCLSGTNSGNVTSVSSGNSGIAIAPTTGDVVVSLASGAAGSGLGFSSGVLSLNLDSGSGLAINSDALSLIRTCGTGQVLKWGGSSWACADDNSGSGSLWTNSSGNATYTDGNVGIGTTTPDFQFHVEGATAGLNLIRTGGGDAFVRLGNGTNHSQIRYDASTQGDIYFTTKDSANEQMRITTEGNIGIGTTSPGVALDVVGQINASTDICLNDGTCLSTSSGTSENEVEGWIYDNDNSLTGPWTVSASGANDINFDSNTFVVDVSENRVGIGTNSPNANLHVANSGVVLLDVESTDNSATQLRLISEGTNNKRIVARNTTGAESQIIFNNNKISFFGSTTSNTPNIGIGTENPTNLLHLKWASSGGVDGIKMDGQYPVLDFNITDVANQEWRLVAGSGAAGDEGKFRITDKTNSLNVMTFENNTGNVGIGTTSPSQKLEVTGGSYPSAVFSGNSNGRDLYVGGGSQSNFGTTEATIGVTNGNLHIDSETSSKIYFQHYATTDTIFNINGGSVGIGTSNPGTKLDVSGTITATGGNSGQWNTAYDRSPTSLSNAAQGSITIGRQGVANLNTNLKNIGVGDARQTSDFSGSTGSSSYMPTPTEFNDKSVTPIFTQSWPGSGWGGIITTKGWSGSSYAAWQMAGTATTSTQDEWYLRSGIGSSWDPWRRIWHDGNDGSGSGLDADTVDNLQASQFLRSDTSDTMNGDLLMNGVNVNSRAPTTPGGWARGMIFQNDAGTRWGGVGILGSGTSKTRMFISHGGTPWSSGEGIYILPNGDTGIGTTDPGEKLEVAGVIKQSGFASDTSVAIGGDHGAVNSQSVAIGRAAQANASTYFGEHTVIGRFAGYQNKGDRITAIGHEAARGNTQGYITTVGFEAGRDNTGTSLTALGYYAGRFNTGNEVTAIGRNAGYDTDQDRSTYIGHYAGYQNTGSWSTFVGRWAGYQNTGSGVTATGMNAGGAKYDGGWIGATGNYLTAMGREAGAGNTGEHTTTVGFSAGYANTGARLNSLGSYAGNDNTGIDVTAIGYRAGEGNSGNNGIFIGHSAGKDNTANNQFIVKQNNVNTVPLMQGNLNNGYLGIGDTSPLYRLELPNTASAAGRGRANSWVTYSDERYKENVSAITNATGLITQLEGVHFNWKENNAKDVGLIAQEVEKTLPEIVSEDDEGYKSLDYARLVAPLIQATKEQQQTIEKLESENEQLRAQQEEILDRLEALEN